MVNPQYPGIYGVKQRLQKHAKYHGDDQGYQIQGSGVGRRTGATASSKGHTFHQGQDDRNHQIQHETQNQDGKGGAEISRGGVTHRGFDGKVGRPEGDARQSRQEKCQKRAQADGYLLDKGRQRVFPRFQPTDAAVEFVAE